MQFQQNIFLFHRTITKLPKIVWLIGIGIVMLLLAYESIVAFSGHSKYPVSGYENPFIELYEQHNQHFQDNQLYLANLKLKVLEDKEKQEKSQGDGEAIPEKKDSQNNDPNQQQQQSEKQQAHVQSDVRASQKAESTIAAGQQEAQQRDKQEGQPEQQQSDQENAKEQEQKPKPWEQDLQHLQELSKLVNDTWLLDIIFTDQQLGEKGFTIEKEQPPYSIATNSAAIDSGTIRCSMTYTAALKSMSNLARNQTFIEKHNLQFWKIKLKPFHEPGLLFGNRQIIRNEQLIVMISSAMQLAQQKIREKLKAQYQKEFPDEGLQAPYPTKLVMQNFAFKSIRLYNRIATDLHVFSAPLNNDFSFLGKPFSVIGIFTNIHIISIFMGLFVRYGLVCILTVYMILGGKGNFQWFSEYYNLIRRRQAGFWKLFFWLCLGMVGTYGLLSMGSWWALTLIFQPVLSLELSTIYYASQTVKILFLAQLSHLLFMHTRTTLYFYPMLSSLLATSIIMIISYNQQILTQFLLTAYVLLQILLTLVMILIEKSIIEEPFHSDYKPSLEKPRMLFYMGYQLSWEKGIPPMWTYLDNWFDWSFVSEREKVYLEGDYQLLYGMMLGINERQPLPEDQEEQAAPGGEHAAGGSQMIEVDLVREEVQEA